jgi:hypothetical protein
MGDRLDGHWRVFRQLHISAAYEFHGAMSPQIHDGSVVPVVVGSTSPTAPLARTSRVPKMFSLFRRKARKTPPATTYTWKPAVDLTDPRVAAILLAFGRA